MEQQTHNTTWTVVGEPSDEAIAALARLLLAAADDDSDDEATTPESPAP